jgi:hypothetical protein
MDSETENIMINCRARIHFIVKEHSQLKLGDGIGIFDIRREFRAIFRGDETQWERALKLRDGRPTAIHMFVRDQRQ